MLLKTVNVETRVSFAHSIALYLSLKYLSPNFFNDRNHGVNQQKVESQKLRIMVTLLKDYQRL